LITIFLLFQLIYCRPTAGGSAVWTAAQDNIQHTDTTAEDPTVEYTIPKAQFPATANCRNLIFFHEKMVFG
jgi:hypothetical protein